jgi:hypothetical protein
MQVDIHFIDLSQQDSWDHLGQMGTLGCIQLLNQIAMFPVSLVDILIPGSITDRLIGITGNIFGRRGVCKRLHILT